MIKKYVYGALAILSLDAHQTKAADSFVQDNQEATTQTQQIAQDQEIHYSLTAGIGACHILTGTSQSAPAQFFMTAIKADIYASPEEMQANNAIGSMLIKVNMVNGEPTCTTVPEKLTFSSHFQNLIMTLPNNPNPFTIPLNGSSDVFLDFTLSEDPMLGGSWFLTYFLPRR